jgi:hypothetical protein
MQRAWWSAFGSLHGFVDSNEREPGLSSCAHIFAEFRVWKRGPAERLNYVLEVVPHEPDVFRSRIGDGKGCVNPRLREADRLRDGVGACLGEGEILGEFGSGSSLFA